jgi:hypothetical protein
LTRRALRRTQQIAAVTFVLLLGGCAALFGIDEPEHDPCAEGGCADDSGANDTATIDAPAPDVSAPASDASDATPDQAAPVGIRCGGGGFPTTWCSGKSICCQTDDDAGLPNYACTASIESCAPGYPIVCAGPKDCATGNVCCHFHSATKCVPSCSEQQVCDPSVDASCPSGKACNVPLIDNGQTSPYLGCAP